MTTEQEAAALGTRRQAATDYALSRRQALRVGLATAALLWLEACTTTNPSSDGLSSAHQHLQQTLADIADNEAQLETLTAIATDIEAQGEQLLAAHQAFLVAFDRLSLERNTESQVLLDLATDYNIEMTRQREALLRAQFAMREELEEDDWAAVVRALNRGVPAEGEDN